MNKLTKDEIRHTVENVFLNKEIMFIYYCGSKAYNTETKDSDIDITVVFRDVEGMYHAPTTTMDIFGYSYNSFLLRQSISDEIPLYNLIHADDIINAKKNLIYLNPKYETEFKNIINIDFKDNLNLYLEAFINYYDDLLNTQKVVVKREYHIFRVKNILENLNKKGKYDVTLDEIAIDKINNHKKNYETLNKDEYLEVLRNDLNYIIEFKTSLKEALENEN